MNNSQSCHIIYEDIKKHLVDLDKISNREIFRTKFSYAVPTKEAVDEIIKFAEGPILEVFAGRGLWAYLINQSGGNVRATDYANTTNNRYTPLKGGSTWTSIENLNAKTAAYSCKENVLMMIWPPYLEWSSADALKGFKGNKFIYIGEPRNGCTGCNEMFDLLKKDWNMVQSIGIPTWSDLDDSVWLYKRKLA